MAEFFTPKNLEEAERDYEESCARRDQFHAEHPQVFNQDISLPEGAELQSGSKESEKIRAQYLALIKECEIKFEGVKVFRKATGTDEGKNA